MAGLSAHHPYPGLRPFGEADAEFFFGREDHVAALYRLFDFSRFVAVVGSSGSGKSSLVRAGLVPLLKQSTERWRIETLRPGDRPLTALAEALSRLAGAVTPADDDIMPEIRRQRIAFHLGRSSEGIARAVDEIPELAAAPILLIVDQFEEIFRYSGPRAITIEERAEKAAREEEAATFVRRLLAASRAPGKRLHILITMRSDFIGDCSRFYQLPEAVSAAQYLTPALKRDERDDAICKPLVFSGSSIESGLVEKLLRDTGNDLDQLPVLQHCLLRLWLRAPADPAGARHITESEYVEIGGLENALSRHADEVMHDLDSDDAVERLFRALSERDQDGRAVRRPRSFRQLVDETGCDENELRRVIDVFRNDACSFLLPTIWNKPQLEKSTYIDVVHEALLRKWTKLSGDGGWLDREADDARTYRALLAILGA